MDNQPRFAYDANGNMVQRTDENDTTWDLAWTPENMLQQATGDNGSSVTLAYDADGMMVQRSENGQTTNRLGKLFEHNTTLGTFTKHYLFGGQLVAMREGLSSSSSVSFFATDHLGSTNVTIWANGSVRSQLRYDPWGGQRWAQSTTPTGYRYTSQRWDAGLGLYDYNARYYDPALGKFISADSIIPQQERLTALTVDFHETQFLSQVNLESQQVTNAGPVFTWPNRLKREWKAPQGPLSPQNLNRYTYASNNPLNHTDPSGHATISIEISAEQAQCIVDYLLGHGDEIGKAEILYDTGQGLVVLGIAVSGIEALAQLYPAIIPTLALLGGLGEISKETANSLTELADLLQAEIDAGAITITIEVEGKWWGEKISVIGHSTKSFAAPMVIDQTGRILQTWMLFVDNDAPVLIDFGLGSFYWRGADGSIAY